MYKVMGFILALSISHATETFEAHRKTLAARREVAV